ncbi:MAG: epoxyqueuosine reductase QueH [Coriobacteriia bacterium]|nr:epoxyqueuosine reductase QueH [Coriobacteriia bacterium]
MGVYDALIGEADQITAIFYNPNIAPEEEYNKRRDACAAYASKQGITFVEVDPDPSDFLDNGQKAEEAQVRDTCQQRCFSCYLRRLDKTAQWAMDNVTKGGTYDSFATTLSISPWQNLEAINRAGAQIAQIHSGLTFVQFDFRSYYRDAQNKARISGIYRQNYCGCLPSKVEAEAHRAARRAARSTNSHKQAPANHK